MKNEHMPGTLQKKVFTPLQNGILLVYVTGGGQDFCTGTMDGTYFYYLFIYLEKSFTWW
jgi:hypothetical protein